MRPTAPRSLTKRSATSPAPAGAADRHRMRWRLLVVLLVASMLHAALCGAVAFTSGSLLITFAAMTVPALATAAWLPKARRHGWHRWATVWGLSLIVVPSLSTAMLALGHAWVLYRAFALDFPREVTR